MINKFTCACGVTWDKGKHIMDLERDLAAANARVGELQQAEKDITSDLAHLLAVAVGGLADAAIVADQSLGVEHVHSAIHKLADYTRELKQGRDAARAERDSALQSGLGYVSHFESLVQSRDRAEAEATALREILEIFADDKSWEGPRDAPSIRVRDMARAALAAAAAVPEPAPDAKPRLGEWQMCACGHFGRSHATVGGNCSECFCDRFHYPKGKPTPITLDEPDARPSEHVHCSNCGKRVSGIDPEMGLVVRAWVECPECTEKKIEPAPDAREAVDGWAAKTDSDRAIDAILARFNDHNAFANHGARLANIHAGYSYQVLEWLVEAQAAAATPPAEPPAVRRNPSAERADGGGGNEKGYSE